MKAAPRKRRKSSAGAIRIGIGGWSFEPWRGVFYPDGLPRAQELSHATRRVTSIEINATFYRTQKPATFASWASQTPEGFVFSVKAPRGATYRGELSNAAPSVERFTESGITALGDRLGPLLWQLPPTKPFDPAEMQTFLAMLPGNADGLALRHAIEVRHASFRCKAFVQLARKYGVAIVYAEHATYPAIADPTAKFVYARLQKGREDLRAGYSRADLDAWVERLTVWANGGCPADLPLLDADTSRRGPPRDVFAYVIHDAKIRAPAAAEALIASLA